MFKAPEQHPEFLYHATRRSNLDSILQSGLLCDKYGAIHGEMEYRPPQKAVYLSTHEHSGNLNIALFADDVSQHEVIVLRLRTSDLDLNRLYPDDAFFYMLDEQFCGDADELTEGSDELREFIEEMSPQFGEMFGLNEEDATRYLEAFCLSDGSHESYSKIATSMGGLRYLQRQGEASYLGDIPPSAIIDWETHPDSLAQVKNARSARPF